jgi:predicted enzyme related to lactoylglutathione lyase
MAQPCWYELMTTDPRGAEGFYRAVVGWDTRPFEAADPSSYTLWLNGERAIGGLMPLPEPARGGPPSWVMYVAVDDADATVAKARSLGGKLEVGPREIPDVGRFAVLSDPQAAVFAILQPQDPAAGGADGPPQQGDISWRELATSDREGAARFYGALFGWQMQNPHDMGEPVGVYQEFGLAGAPLGGIYRKPKDAPGPSSWLFYARVRDLGAALAAAGSHGGQVLAGPMEVPGGGHIAQLRDPQGAMFALHQPRS